MGSPQSNVEGEAVPKNQGDYEWPQPCVHFAAERGCSIYPDRPSNCVKFECFLLYRLRKNRVSLSDAIGIVNLTKRHRGEILTALDAKATFLRPIPLLKKIELVFLKNGSSPQQNLKEDPDAFLAVGVLERLIRKHFLADKEGAEVSEESAG